MGQQCEPTRTDRDQPVLSGTGRDEKILQEIFEQAREQTRLLLHHQGVVADLARQRKQTVAVLRGMGVSQLRLARILGVSPGRIAQIDESRGAR